MGTTETFESCSPDETHAIGLRIGRGLSVGDCLALVGGLGAGKTALARGLAEGLGADASLVSSPTYVLLQEYPGPVPMFHVDLYRMTAPEAEFADLGIEEMLAAGVVVVEWADRAPDALPRTHRQITMEITGETSRRISLASIDRRGG